MHRYKYFLALAILAGILLPLGFAFAHTPSLFPAGFWGPIVSCGYEGGPACTSLCDLLHTAQHLIYLGLTILVFIITPIAVIAGGISIMTSAGSEERLKTGKKIVTSAVSGLAIGLGGFVLINTLLWALGGLNNQQSISWPNIQCSVAPYTPPPVPTGGGVNLGAPPSSGAPGSQATPLPAGTLSHV